MFGGIYFNPNFKTGFLAGGKRSSTFTYDFLNKNFGEEHKKATGKDFNKRSGGYPDMGSGKYA